MYKTIAITAALIVAPTALAQERDREHNHEDIHHAAEAAHADPRSRPNRAVLNDIIENALHRYPGQITEVSYDDGEYDIEIRQSNGRKAKLEYSAQTGRLLDADVDRR